MTESIFFRHGIIIESFYRDPVDMFILNLVVSCGLCADYGADYVRTMGSGLDSLTLVPAVNVPSFHQPKGLVRAVFRFSV